MNDFRKKIKICLMITTPQPEPPMSSAQSEANSLLILEVDKTDNFRQKFT